MGGGPTTTLGADAMLSTAEGGCGKTSSTASRPAVCAKKKTPPYYPGVARQQFSSLPRAVYDSSRSAIRATMHHRDEHSSSPYTARFQSSPRQSVKLSGGRRTRTRGSETTITQNHSRNVGVVRRYVCLEVREYLQRHRRVLRNHLAWKRSAADGSAGVRSTSVYRATKKSDAGNKILLLSALQQ